MTALLERIRTEGGAKEIHVRIACPPIIAPCFYGIDMSSIRQLFAPRFMEMGQPMTPEVQAQMASELKADSLRYLPLEAVARSIGFKPTELCQACISGRYPTTAGQELFQIDLEKSRNNSADDKDSRAYESDPRIRL
jgi:amidophosphoribosyltransferase